MKRLKQCPVCRKRLGFILDERDGQTKIENHATAAGNFRCPGSGMPVSQR